MTISPSLCLDFANTVSWRGTKKSQEKLPHYPGLVAWARQTGIVTLQQARRILAHQATSPAAAAAALERALLLRESIYRTIAAVTAGRPCPPSDLAILNKAMREASAHLQIIPEARGFAWRWLAEADALDRIVWLVARSAAELLTSAELKKVRVCAGTGCGWLFLDLSRNGTRRWCAMSDCGNREKARRHYERVRSTNRQKE